MRRLVYKLTFAIALTGLAAATALAQDPVKVSPNEYKVVLENDRVRVVRLKRAPHAKSPEHEHSRDFAVVFLTDSHQRVHNPDGTTREAVHKKGEVIFNHPTKHWEENVTDQPLEVVAVEFKGKPSPNGAAPLVESLDPAKIDPKYHTVDFENGRVRSLRTSLPPHLKSPKHNHPAYVVVYLTDLHTKMEHPDGTVTDNYRKAGDVAFREKLQHSTENVDDTPAMEIQLELK